MSAPDARKTGRDLAAELAAQGLPLHIEDEATLARLAALVMSLMKKTGTPTRAPVFATKESGEAEVVTDRGAK